LIGQARLEPADCRLYAANGTSITVMGEVVLDIRLGVEVIPTRFIVSNNVTEPMLGIDWLRLNRATWNFEQDWLVLDDTIIRLVTEGKNKTNSCRRVVSVEDVSIPARSQVVVLGRVEMNRMSPEPADSVWTAEARQLRTGVMVARAVFFP